MRHIDFLQLLPFFSGFFFLLSFVGGGLWTAAGAGEAEGAGPEGGAGADFETHSATVSPAGMGTHTAGGNRNRQEEK